MNIFCRESRDSLPTTTTVRPAPVTAITTTPPPETTTEAVEATTMKRRRRKKKKIIKGKGKRNRFSHQNFINLNFDKFSFQRPGRRSTRWKRRKGRTF